MTTEKPMKKLYRSRRDKLLGGVCGGLAEYLGWDPTLVRIAYALISIFSAAFPGVLVYIVFWIVMPMRPIGEYSEPGTGAS